jgi:ATP-dependent DNA helicase RecQ
MAAFLPQDEAEMLKISGVGDLKMEKYGRAFLAVIGDYCKRMGLASKIDQKRQTRQQKNRPRRDASGSDTFSTTFKMFRAGRSVTEIAADRGLAVSTVEGHLARFIQAGEIRLEEIVAPHKVEPIKKAIIEADAGEAIGPVKQLLGEEYSYGEIRAVAAAFLQEQ